jgi:hypothetical protein
MALTLCPNCRLPVNTSLQRCPLCASPRRSPSATRQVSLAAALAVAATAIALVTRRTAV